MTSSSSQPGPAKRVLAVMLEFNDWREAKPWSYLASYALLDGFDACGVDWTVLPAVVIYGDRSINPWVDARETLLEGQTFDQVWVWLTHAHYPPDFWPWLEKIAPVRVGVLMESLRYTPEEVASWDGYAKRFDAGVQQMKHLTHVISYDEQDVAELHRATGLPTSLYHSMIPASMVRELPAPEGGKVLFLGTLYDKRQAFLETAGLGDRVEMMASPETGAGLQAQFDEINRQYLEELQQGRMTGVRMKEFVRSLQAIRRRVLEGVMDAYRHGIAVLNLPAYFKGYPGRVVEALAAGVPMVTNQLDNRPQTAATFDHRRHILYYDPTDPADLRRQLDALAEDAPLRRRMVVEGRSRLLESLTSEVQMPALLSWIERTRGNWLQRQMRRLIGR